MKLKTVIIFIGAILLVQAILLAFGLYNLFPAFDIPMHFSGGFGMAMLGIYLHLHMVSKHKISGHPQWYHFLFVLGFTMFIGVVWELHEFIFDLTIGHWINFGLMQASLKDTMGDLIMDALGGVVGFLIFKRQLCA